VYDNSDDERLATIELNTVADVGKAALKDNILLFPSSSFIKVNKQQPAPPKRNAPLFIFPFMLVHC